MDRGVGALSDAHPIEAVLGYRFRDVDLAETALAHPSYAYEIDATRGNERLEFLGDAVLDLAIAQILYETHTGWSEGELTRTRAALVNRSALARCARELELGRLIKLGKTEQQSGGADKDSILANCFEALVGAVYLDGGLDPVVALVRRSFRAALERGVGASKRDPKTQFQEWAHSQFRTTPTYETISDSGVDADEERFTVEVCVGGKAWGRGAGRSKRIAERCAAEAALAREGRADD